jgi:hypothetical protein
MACYSIWYRLALELKPRNSDIDQYRTHCLQHNRLNLHNLSQPICCKGFQKIRKTSTLSDTPVIKICVISKSVSLGCRRLDQDIANQNYDVYHHLPHQDMGYERVCLTYFFRSLFYVINGLLTYGDLVKEHKLWNLVPSEEPLSNRLAAHYDLMKLNCSIKLVKT